MNTLLVTGANRGLGLELVKQYAQSGWQVLACCRNPSEALQLQQLSDEFGERIRILEIEVSDALSIALLKKEIGDLAIDLLINNAAITGPNPSSAVIEASFKTAAVSHAQDQIKPVTDLVDGWLNTFKINSIAPMLMAEAFVENLSKGEHKTIANISSTMGSIEKNTSGTANIVYRSSKSALNAVTKALSIDFKTRGITVVCLHPGWVKTDMGGAHADITPQESISGIKTVLSKVSLQHTGQFIDYQGNELPW